MSATPSAADREGTLALWHARHSGAIRVTPALGAVLQALAALSLILWRPTVSEDRGASRAPERLLFVRQPHIERCTSCVSSVGLVGAPLGSL